MSIDTAQKRMSVFELPGLMTNPFPNAGVQQADRQQMSDVYVGILAQIPSFLPNQTCWVDEKTRTDIWSKEKKRTDIWTKETEEIETWSDEKEITPC